MQKFSCKLKFPLQARQTPFSVQLSHLRSHQAHVAPLLQVSRLGQSLQLFEASEKSFGDWQSKHFELLSKQFLQSEAEHWRQLAPPQYSPTPQYQQTEPFRVPCTLHFVQVVAFVVHSRQLGSHCQDTLEPTGKQKPSGLSISLIQNMNILLVYVEKR